MKVVFRSDYVSWDESAEAIAVVQLDEGEYDELVQMSHDEKCRLFGVAEYPENMITPGMSYHTYDFELTCKFLLMFDTLALDV